MKELNIVGPSPKIMVTRYDCENVSVVACGDVIEVMEYLRGFLVNDDENHNGQVEEILFKVPEKKHFIGVIKSKTTFDTEIVFSFIFA